MGAAKVGAAHARSCVCVLGFGVWENARPPKAMEERSSLSAVAVAVAAVAGALGRARYRLPEVCDRRMANEPVGRVVVCASVRRGA